MNHLCDIRPIFADSGSASGVHIPQQSLLHFWLIAQCSKMGRARRSPHRHAKACIIFRSRPRLPKEFPCNIDR